MILHSGVESVKTVATILKNTDSKGGKIKGLMNTLDIKKRACSAHFFIFLDVYNS